MDNPILNNPYHEPQFHYALNVDRTVDYENIQKDRRLFIPELPEIPSPKTKDKSLFTWEDLHENPEQHLINLCRKEVGKWRKQNYPNTTRITKELLEYWFLNPKRPVFKNFFFAQREAIETAIWLNEIAERSNSGKTYSIEFKKEEKL